MAKTFDIVKRKNLLTGEEKVVHYTYGRDEASRKRVLEKLNRSLKGEESRIYEYRYGESLYMHLLPGLSENLVRELSSRMYYTAYAVCKKNEKDEKVLYLSLFKDSALRFKAAIPSATIKVRDKEVPNPRFFVRELRLCL